MSGGPSDGSRTKTGCWTCRIRRKKCDENKPNCLNCSSREIFCYGYGPRPAWMHGMRYWRDILASEQAKAIRESAERNHRRRRGAGASEGAVSSIPNTNRDASQSIATGTILASSQTLVRPYTTDSSIWNDGSGLLTGYSHVPHFPLVLTFLDVIFPLQYGFYDVEGQSDRTWLSNAILENVPFYQASLGLCICFISGARTGNTSGLCQMTPDVRRLQISAVQGLQPRINEMGELDVRGEVFLSKAVQAISIILHLLSLEIYAPLEGAWEIHMNAAKILLDMIETRWMPLPFHVPRQIGRIGEVLASSIAFGPRQNFEFFLTSYIWVNIMAEAVHGHEISVVQGFDYLPLLRQGLIDFRKLMGCHTLVMLAIREITLLDAWIRTPPEIDAEIMVAEKQFRCSNLGSQLESGIEELESRLCYPPENLVQDSDWVTIIHAYAAVIYLHTISHGPFPDSVEIAKNVTRCLECLEILPTRLFIRVCWPFTIAGCMANVEQHARFRALTVRVEAEKQVLGFTWKGVVVMEECWRLRSSTNGLWCWRTTMKHKGLKILLI